MHFVSHWKSIYFFILNVNIGCFANALKWYGFLIYLKLRSVFFQIPGYTKRNLPQGTFQGTLDSINFIHTMLPLLEH